MNTDELIDRAIAHRKEYGDLYDEGIISCDDAIHMSLREFKKHFTKYRLKARDCVTYPAEMYVIRKNVKFFAMLCSSQYYKEYKKKLKGGNLDE
jgi:hypothetical protein